MEASHSFDAVACSADDVIHGDCTEVLPRLRAESVDLIVTDPPYFVRYQDRFGRTIANDAAPTHSVLGAFDDLYRVLRPDCFCICFYGWNKVDHFFRAWRKAGFQPVGHIVWPKLYASSSRFLQARHEQAYLLAKGRPAKPARSLPDVQPWHYTGNHHHPTEKSVKILCPLIRTFSRPGAWVLDPFAGSGSTLVAAAMCGRRALGIELDSQHCTTARTRLAALAPRLSSGGCDPVDRRDLHDGSMGEALASNDEAATWLANSLRQMNCHDAARLVADRSRARS